ncbi:MAG TPA: ribosome maturation factor RimM [Sphingomicrobium sp.]|nr:ribosome maturation factor RimM [Sphingomicrobium sp.]
MKDLGERKIALAAVAGAHGVKGEVRLKLFTQSVNSLKRHEKLHVGSAERRLLAISESGKTIIASFEGISDRSAAEALRGEIIEISRSDLPQLGEDEYYYAELIGLPAVDRDGMPVGSVVAVENYGAGDLLEIEDLAGRRLLIPFRGGIADLEDARVVLDREFLA